MYTLWTHTANKTVTKPISQLLRATRVIETMNIHFILIPIGQLTVELKMKLTSLHIYSYALCVPEINMNLFVYFNIKKR